MDLKYLLMRSPVTDESRSLSCSKGKKHFQHYKNAIVCKLRSHYNWVTSFFNSVLSMLNTKKDRISLKNIIPVSNKHSNSLVVLFVKMKCRFFPP